MAAELGKVRLGNLTGTLILRMDDGSEVEVGNLSMPVDAMVSVTMPASAPVPDPRAPGYTEHELNQLPNGAKVVDKDKDTWVKQPSGRWFMKHGNSVSRSSEYIIGRYGPITAE